MRVLYIATSFPEPTKGATIYTDLAEALFEAGHEVVVAVSEQTKNIKRSQLKKERGFDVLRIVTGNYYDVSLLEKGITTLRIPSIMIKGITQHLGHKTFDFILYEAPPVTNSSLVSWAKKKFKCPSYLMLKDIFPQNAVDLGIMEKNSIIYKFFKNKERKLYESADVIGCMSEANRHYIIKHNAWLHPDKIEIFPNTKRLTQVSKLSESDIRIKYSIPKNACVFLFGGNMGKPQYIELLCNAITECKNDENIFFIFVGRGTERYKIVDTIKNEVIHNAIILANLPRDEYEEITKESDVGLIILDPRFTIPNYPSRILSYMEYSKPVIAATDRSTDIKELIEKAKCGEWVWSGDKEGFIQTIKKFSNSTFLKEMGMNGRYYIENNFSLSSSVEILERHYKK